MAEDLRDAAVVATYRVGAAVAQRLPRRVGTAVGRSLMTASALALPERRRLVARHLRRASDGRLTGLELQRAVLASFDSYGRYWLEFFRLPTDGREPVRMRATGFEHIKAAMEAGSGVILGLPHLGGWEHGGVWLAQQGYPLTTVVEPVRPAELYAIFRRVREDLGMELVDLGPDAAPALLRALRANRPVCLLCDRDLTGDGVEVEFFGERTTLPAGPAVLALRSGAPLLPAGVYFEGDGHYADIRPPVDTTRRGRLRDDVARVTQDLARVLEELIAAAPEQWHLQQPNWPSDRAAGFGDVDDTTPGS